MLIIRVDGPYFLAKVKVGFGLVKVNTTQVPLAPFGSKYKMLLRSQWHLCSVYFVNPTKPNQTLDFGQNVVSSHPKDEHFVTQVSQMSKAKLASTLEEY